MASQGARPTLPGPVPVLPVSGAQSHAQAPPPPPPPPLGSVPRWPAHSPSPSPTGESPGTSMHSNSSPLLQQEKEQLAAGLAAPAAGPGRVRSWCTFSSVFLLLCGGSIVVACVFVWWLGYASTLRTVDNLSSRIRRTIGAHVRFSVAEQLGEPLLAANQLGYLARRAFPNISQTGTFTTSPGFASDITSLMLGFPSVQQMVVTADNRFILLAQRLPGNSLKEIVYTLGDERLTAIGLAQETNALNTSYFPGALFIQQYLPYLTQPDLFEQESASPNWALLQPDVSAEATFTALGPLAADTWFPFPGQDALYEQAWYPHALALNGTLGWTQLQLTNGAIEFGGVRAVTNIDGAFAFNVLGVSTVDYLDGWLADLSTHASTSAEGGAIFIVLQDGRMLGSSLQDKALHGAFVTNSSHVTLKKIGAVLLDLGLLDLSRPQPVFQQNLGLEPAPPMREHDVHVVIEGSDYHLFMSTSSDRGLNWINVVMTLDAEFTRGLSTTIRDTALTSAGVLLAAVLITLGFGVCLVTRPLTRLTTFMSEVEAATKSPVNAKPGMGPGGNLAGINAEKPPNFADILQRWMDGIGQKPTRTGDGTPPTLDTNDDRLSSAPASVTLRSRLVDLCCATSCSNSSLQPMELRVLQSTFTSMLWSLKESSERVTHATDAKRHFIRYIFHEIRVPFNAVVLGIEHLTTLVPRIGDTSSMRSFPEVVHLLSEQADIVRRILNDVLSLQKIEEGGLQLEYLPFSLERMIVSTFQSFSAMAQDKHVTMRLELDSLDEFIDLHYPAWRYKQSSAAAGNGNGLGRIHASSAASTTATLPPSRQTEVMATPSAAPRQVLHLHKDRSASAGANPHALSSTSLVLGDQFRLRQVLANFLSNAIKFSEQSGTVFVRLSISRWPKSGTVSQDAPPREAASGVHVHSRSSPDAPRFPAPSPTPRILLFRVSVFDDGCGLTQAEQAQLFVPYTQIRAGDKQQGGGTGLGLTNAKLLVELHGGTIGCASPVRHPAFAAGTSGSEFFFELPLEVADSSQAAKSPPAGGSGSGVAMEGTSVGASTATSSSAASGSTPTLFVRALCGDEQAQAAVQRMDDPSLQQQQQTKSARTPAPVPMLMYAEQGSDTEQEIGVQMVRFHDEPSTVGEEALPLPHTEAEPGSAVAASARSSLLPPLPHPLPAAKGFPSLPPTPALRSRTLFGPSPGVAVGVGDGGVSGSSSPRLRCLVVDDSSATRKLLIMLLKSMGCAAQGVEDGLQCVNIFLNWKAEQEAVAAAANTRAANPPNPASSADGPSSSSSSSAPLSSPPLLLPPCPFDLVLMDSVMPSMNGLEACRILRAKGITLPIVGATGNALAEDVAQFMSAGANDVLTKPISRADLQCVIDWVKSLR